MAIFAGWAAAATLTGMSVSAEGEVTRIHVSLDEPVEFSHFTVKDPARLYVDCRGVDQIGMESLPQGEGLAGPIEASVWKGDAQHTLTRISIDLEKSVTSEVRQVDDGLLITLRPESGDEWTLGAAPESQPDSESATQPETARKKDALTPAEEKSSTRCPPGRITRPATCAPNPR